MTFQQRVVEWLRACFLNTAATKQLERSDRFAEEAIELLQSTGYPRERIVELVDYVYGRPPGEPAQEVGGVLVTLAALCWTAGVDMHAAGEAELARNSQPDRIARLRAKDAAKVDASALPGNIDAIPGA